MQASLLRSLAAPRSASPVAPRCTGRSSPDTAWYNCPCARSGVPPDAFSAASPATSAAIASSRLSASMTADSETSAATAPPNSASYSSSAAAAASTALRAAPPASPGTGPLSPGPCCRCCCCCCCWGPSGGRCGACAAACSSSAAGEPPAESAPPKCHRSACRRTTQPCSTLASSGSRPSEPSRGTRRALLPSPLALAAQAAATRQVSRFSLRQVAAGRGARRGNWAASALCRPPASRAY